MRSWPQLEFMVIAKVWEIHVPDWLLRNVMLVFLSKINEL